MFLASLFLEFILYEKAIEEKCLFALSWIEIKHKTRHC